MSSTLNVTVKNANIISKLITSPIGPFAIFTKYSVHLYLNGKDHGKLKASKTPYQISIEPGEYILQVSRNTLRFANMSSAGFKITDAVLSASLTGGTDWSGVGFSDIDNSSRKKGTISFTISDKQIINLEIRHNFDGYPIPVIL